MVLGAWKWKEGLSVGEDHEGGLLPLEAVFDHHPLSRGAEDLFHHDLLDGLLGLLHRAADDDPFARGEAIGLDHDGGPFLLHVGQGLFRVLKHLEGRGRDAVFGHEPFGEDLAPLYLGGLGAGAEDLKPPLGEIVRYPFGERVLWPHHGEGDPFLLGEVGQGLKVVHRDGNALTLGLLGDPGVPRGAEDLFHQGTLGKLPAEGVFPSTASHDQYLHAGPPWRSFSAS